MEIQTGGVVISAAGRDAGKAMCVVAVDESWVYVCDGKERPLSNPKRKNPKHVKATHMSLSGEDLRSDHALRRALAALRGETTGGL